MIAAGNQTTDSHEPRDTRDSIDEPNTIDQRAILDAFLSRSLPLPDLANHFNISITDLIEALSTPENQQQLEAARQLADLQFHLLHQQAKAAALETLTQIATDPAADPTERRRAATAILRPTPLRNRAHDPSRGSSRQHASSPGAQCPVPDAFPPQTTPKALIEYSLAVLAKTDLTPAQAIAQIHTHFEPTATINDQPIPQDPQDFDETIATDLAHCVQYFKEVAEIGEDTAHYRIVFVHNGGRCLYVNLDTAKQPDNTWRFTNITTEPIDSS